MGNLGISKLASTIAGRMKQESESPLVLDFGQINTDFSLQTNTFPIPIPKQDYTVCRSVAYGAAGSQAGETSVESSPDSHRHKVILPNNMRSIASGDRVLVAWVQNEPVVIDIILSASKI